MEGFSSMRWCELDLDSVRCEDDGVLVVWLSWANSLGFSRTQFWNKEAFFEFSNLLLIATSFEFKTCLNFERLSTRETKYKSTHQDNKICSGMNATNIYLFN
jgi:hypothetical protein